MSNGYVISIDPSELANRFSSEDPRFDNEDEKIDEDLVTNVSADVLSDYLSDGDYESRISPLLDCIPEREADLIYLYFIQKKRQADIAAIFGVTQAAISYRLDRGIKRLKFLLSIPTVSKEDLETNLATIFPQKIDIDILIGMWVSTCQSEVASKLGLTQGRVRHRFFKAVKTLQETADKDEQYRPYEKIFSAIAQNFNIRREVSLPQWKDRGGDECT